MKNFLKYLLLFALILGMQVDGISQKKRTSKNTKSKTEKKMSEIKLKDGTTLIGEILSYDKNEMVLMTEKFGEMTIKSDEIDSVSDDNPLSGQWNKAKYSSQYFLSPTARPVGKGNKFYTNFDIIGNTFNFGISDNFSIGVGAEAASLFAGNFPITYVNPKFSFGQDNLYFGLGTTLFVVPFDGSVEFGGIGYGNVTIGSDIKNFTVGVGFLYTFEDSSDVPVFQLGFTVPLSQKISFIGEGFFTSDVEGIYNLGIRIITKGNIAFDVGLTRPTVAIDALGVPLLAVSIPLGKQ